MNKITKSSEDARREAQQWLARTLSWERTLDRLRDDEPTEVDATATAPAHREAA